MYLNSISTILFIRLSNLIVFNLKMIQMPRIWLDYCEFLKEQGAITKTRRTFDRALRSLPITQHKRIWEKYLTFANECGVVETAVRIYRRYIKVHFIPT